MCVCSVSSRVATTRVCAVRYEDGSMELFPFHEAQDRIAKAAGGDETTTSLSIYFCESADIEKISESADIEKIRDRE